MTFPVVTVEVAFGTDPFSTPSASGTASRMTEWGAYSASGVTSKGEYVRTVGSASFTEYGAFVSSPPASVWSDVTPYIREITIDRGRSHELQRTQAGTATLRLANGDRRFDPTYASSPYYPNVVPLRRLRVVATQNGVTYPLFAGYVENWGQVWPNRTLNSAGDAEVQVQCVDAFKFLSLYEISTGTLYTDLINALGVSALWKMNDLTSPITSASPSLNVGTGVTLGYDTTLPPIYGAARCLDINPVDAVGGGLEKVNNGDSIWGNPIASTVSYSFWLRLDSYSTDGWIVHFETPGTTYHELKMNASGSGIYFWTGTGYPIPTATLTQPSYFVADGQWHHYALVASLNSGVSYGASWWRDGALVGVTSAAVGAGGSASYNAINTTTIGGSASLGGAHGIDGSLSYFAIWRNLGLSDYDIGRLAAGGWDYIAADKAGVALRAFLDAAGWPAAERDLDDGQIDMQAITPSGSMLELVMRMCEDTERGLFHVSGDGSFVFRDSDSLASTPTQASFGDSASENVVYADLEFRYDDQDIYPRVVVTREGGVAQTVVDSAAVARFGPETLSLSGLLFVSDADAAKLAAYLGSRYRIPALRPVKMILTGSDVTSNGAWAQMLGRQPLHDQIALVRRPPGGGTTISMLAHIEGVHHHIMPAAMWETAFNLTPEAGTWLVDDDTWAILESTTYIGWPPGIPAATSGGGGLFP